MATHTRPFWVIDCETDPFKFKRIPQPFLWGLYTGQDYYEFDTADKLIEFIKDKEVIIYAHNGGKFDYYYLEEHFDSGPVLIINSRLAKFKIGLAEFRDSYSILPIALAKFCKTKIDYAKFEERVRHKHMREISSYLKDDCVYLYEMVKKFRQDYGTHITIATAAMANWRQMSGIPLPKSSAFFYDEMSPYYYGGRVQCFKAGDFTGDYKSYDINSAYPFAMMHQHPISVTGGNCYGIPKGRAMGPCFFEVTCLSQGAFPYRGIDGSMFFPDWRIEGPKLRSYYVSGWELKAAIETATIKNVRVGLCTFFDQTIDFKVYIDRFWKLKKEASAVLKKHPHNKEAKLNRENGKVFLNSLYGKFAANPRKYERINYHKGFEGWADTIDNEIETIDGNHGYFLVSENESDFMRFYNIATAASITGFVRAYLWKYILRAQHPLYCDTDSIVAKSFKKFPLGDGLGEWSCEGEFDRVAIGGKKLYAMHYKGKSQRNQNWKLATKGVRLSAREVVKVCAGDTITFNPEVPTYSIHRMEPIFTPRKVKITARDIRRIPEKCDPLLNSDRKIA